jgi:predicted ArsR family transcriptional regulator
MEQPGWNKRFLETTRGRIVGLLRVRERTVAELAQGLGLTDNAVRQHLATLERDGMIQRCGTVAGVRKPHVTYALSLEAEHLFPKAFALTLEHLLSALADRCSTEELEGVLRDAGRRLAAEVSVNGPQADDLAEGLEAAMAAFSALGGLADIELSDGKRFLRGGSCPLATVPTRRPEVCIVTEELLRQVTGLAVKSICEQAGPPQCCFELPSGD